MTQESELSPTAASFAQHVREFHRGLPNEEKQLLEQIFALAEAANAALRSDNAEVRGYAVDAFLKYAGGQGGADSKHKGEFGAQSAYLKLQPLFNNLSLNFT
jgi:hypothetical protein